MAFEIKNVESYLSGESLNKIITECKQEYVILVHGSNEIDLSDNTITRFVQVAEDTGAGMIYSDYREKSASGYTDHPLIDYRFGSIRDTFDFGSVILISKRAAENVGGADNSIEWGGLYDLRLKLSAATEILRIPEFLYTKVESDLRATGEKVFDYVDPRNREYQIEMERIATDHLKRIGAWLKPKFKTVVESSNNYPVTASVIIPVRNRVKTVADAVQSALSQKTDFPFNVIVVDNHSNDGTTELLKDIASKDDRLIHVIPTRDDLIIGGCWNLAINSEYCGRYAVQLDSDDIYSSNSTLSRVVDEFRKGGYAMIIGSYTITDFDLKELPPGLIDHKEWTRDNGRNNALRINGLGAPRAFDVNVLRNIGFPNVGYGEDYAVALCISRDYEIGRIYDSLYHARRWAGNSDSALPLVTMNRYDSYKDLLRTIEIKARQKNEE